MNILFFVTDNPSW